MKTTRFFLFATLMLLAVSCTLSARQEEHLNTQLGKYIASHNQERLLELIGLSHPAVVKYYKAQGDSAFIEHFKDMDTLGKTYFANPTYREMKEKGKLIQRKYEVEYYNSLVEINPRYCIFALSDDGGNNWFFVRNEDYYDKKIPGLERLF